MPKRSIQIALITGHILFLICARRIRAQDAPLTAAEADAVTAQQADLDGVRLDPNRADAEDLLALPGLTPDLAWRIAAFRPYRRIEDLRRVPGLSAEGLSAIAPYLAFDRPQRLQTHLTGRITRPSGYADRPDQMRFYERLDVAQSNAFSACLLAERDPEEPGLADFVTGYLTVRRPGARLVVGDVRPAFGQGLILSRSTRAAADLAWARPGGMRLDGNRTSTEYGAVRGGLLAVTHGALTAIALYGHARWDADLSTGVPDLRLSGLHTSEMSRQRKGDLRENIAAFRLSMGAPQMHLAATLLQTAFRPAPPPEAASRLIGLDGQWRNDRLTLFGEAAAGPKDRAWVLGAQIRFPDLRLYLLGRRYGPQFQSLHGAPFAAFGTPPNNEWGAFFGLTWRTGKRTRLECALDRHGRIAPDADHPLPERGDRIRIALRRRLRAGLSLRLVADARTRTDQPTRRSLRADLSGRFRKLAVTTWAAQIAAGAPGRALGARLSAQSAHLAATVWTTAFAVADYDARIYAFEPDVWGGGSLLTLSGHGHADGLRLTVTAAPFRLAVRCGLRAANGRHTTSWAAQIDLTP